MGELVGAGVEVAIGERLVAKAHGRGVGRRPGLGLEQIRRCEMFGERRVGAVPIHQQELMLRMGEHGQAGDRGIGIGRDAFQEFGEVPHHPLDGLAIENIGVEFERAAELPGLLLHKQGQVEFGGAAVRIHGLDAQVGDHLGLGGHVLQGEHDLEKGALTEAALGLHGLHHHLERHILMGVGIQGRIAKTGEKFAEAGFAGEVSPQDQGVDKEANQIFGRPMGAARDGRAYADVILMGVAIEQDIERGQQGHEQGRALPLRQSRQGWPDLRGQLECQIISAEALDRRAGPIGGEFQQRGRSPELLAPEIKLALQHVPLQPVALPHGEIGVLDGQLGQRRRAALGERVIQARDLGDEDVGRPVVGNDVVEGEEDNVIAIGQPQEFDPQQGARSQVEGGLRLLIGQPSHLSLLLILA